MTVADFQGSYNGLSFGAGTSFGVTKWDWSLPPLAGNSLARTRLDGSFVGLDLAQPRPIMIDFAIPNLGDGNYYANREAWRGAFTVQSAVVLPLSLLIPGWSAARRFYCRPSKRHDPESNVSSIALSEWTTEMTADDPLLYDDTATVVAAASSISVTNNGDYPTGSGPTPGIATITVSSACTITGPSGSLTLTGTGPWTLDLGTHSVTGGNGYRDLTQPPAWFFIPPGTSTISASAGTVGCTFRSAWM